MGPSAVLRAGDFANRRVGKNRYVKELFVRSSVRPFICSLITGADAKATAYSESGRRRMELFRTTFRAAFRLKRNRNDARNRRMD